MTLKHGFESTIADGSDTSVMRPSDFGSTSTDYDVNPTHVFSGGTVGNLLARASNADGSEWTDSPTVANMTVTEAFDAVEYPFIHVSYLGDSIVNQDLPTWPDYIASYHSYFAKAGNAINYGVNGARASALVTGYTAGTHVNRPTRTIDDGWFFLHAGGNDISDGVSAATVYSYLVSLWASARTDGYKVVAVTVLPRSSWGSGSAAVATALNKLILSDTTLYDYVVRADRVLTDPTNALHFYDTTHPTVLGAQLIAAAIATAITTPQLGVFGGSAVTGTLVTNDSQVIADSAVISLGTDAVRGFLFIINHTNGAQALFTLNGTGNAAVEISDPAGIYTVTAGTSSSINVYWSAANSRYELENKRGVSITLSLIRLGV